MAAADVNGRDIAILQNNPCIKKSSLFFNELILITSGTSELVSERSATV